MCQETLQRLLCGIGAADGIFTRKNDYAGGGRFSRDTGFGLEQFYATGTGSISPPTQ